LNSGEVLHELRESYRRQNELFAIMTFRSETEAFGQSAIDLAAGIAGLKPVLLAREFPLRSGSHFELDQDTITWWTPDALGIE
jgi:hypothetical protein